MIFIICFSFVFPVFVMSETITYYGGDFNIVNNVISYKISDRLGAERLSLDGDEVVSEFDNLPYGQQLKNSNVKFGFNNKELDKTDNYYFNARYYDYDSGKFLGVDSVSDNHAYAFVSNNPMNYVDPSGMAGIPISPDMGKTVEAFRDIMQDQQNLYAEYESKLEEVDFDRNNPVTIEFLKKAKYFGSDLGSDTKKYYNSLGLKQTSCIEGVLDALTKASGTNFRLRKYNDFGKLARALYATGNYDAIVMIPNAKKDFRYMQSYDYRVSTEDTTNNIKNGKYFMPVDYLVTDYAFSNPDFQESLSKLQGLMAFQEGFHSMIFDKGMILETHWGFDPRRLSEGFTEAPLSNELRSEEYNDGYQTAILLVPKGSFTPTLGTYSIDWAKAKQGADGALDLFDIHDYWSASMRTHIDKYGSYMTPSGSLQ